ncbi:MAG: hypothetical protein AUK37_04505 [Rhodobacterales bacterium CG2_30_65_12]|nr:MAG: hypothetical protein AUK37_04505 [Rhodobacterales bacterium CG2_30_65_12]
MFARAFELAFKPAMRIEPERLLGAGHYRDTPAGTVHVDEPKTAGHGGARFCPQSLVRGRRSVRAVMLALAVMCTFGVVCQPSSQVTCRSARY